MTTWTNGVAKWQELGSSRFLLLPFLNLHFAIVILQFALHPRRKGATG
jgi:hypothetical protein